MSKRQLKSEADDKQKKAASQADRSWETVFLQDDRELELEKDSQAFLLWMEKALLDFDSGKIATVKTESAKAQKVRNERPKGKQLRLLWETAPALDLHGLNRRQALQSIGAFLSEQRELGNKWVTVIVGKGHHSQDGRAILRDEAERILSALKKEGRISDWFWEYKDKNKSGAVMVRLHTLDFYNRDQ